MEGQKLVFCKHGWYHIEKLFKFKILCTRFTPLSDRSISAKPIYSVYTLPAKPIYSVYTLPMTKSCNFDKMSCKINKDATLLKLWLILRMIIHFILKLITDQLADRHEYIFVGWKENKTWIIRLTGNNVGCDNLAIIIICYNRPILLIRGAFHFR